MKNGKKALAKYSDLPPYVYITQTRHGKRRLRYRRKTFQRWLPDKNSPDFERRYAEVMLEYQAVKSPHSKFSLSWLISDYQAHNPAYKELGKKTRKDKDALYTRMQKAWGKNDIRELSRPVLIMLMDAIEAPATHNRILTILRQLFAHAQDRGYLKGNIALTVSKRKTKTKTTHAWTYGERMQFEQHWPSGSRERLAYTLMFVTCQGSADVSKMGRHMEREGRIEGKRVKTGVAYCAPINAALETEISHWRKQLVYILTNQGATFTERGFHNWFSKAINAAGLPERCTPHGLRGAGCTELAETRSTANEIMAIAGFETMSEAQKYVKSANKKKLADSGAKKRFMSNQTGKDV